MTKRRCLLNTLHGERGTCSLDALTGNTGSISKLEYLILSKEKLLPEARIWEIT